MSENIVIKTGDLKINAQLNDSKTAKMIYDKLPIEGRVRLWAEEIYFEIPVKLGEENAQEVVEKGDIGYWPPGRAFCLFFGLTPVSKGEEIRPASPVNVFGKIVGNLIILKKIENGTEVNIERV